MASGSSDTQRGRPRCVSDLSRSAAAAMQQPGPAGDQPGLQGNMVTTSFPLTTNTNIMTFMKPINQNVVSVAGSQHTILPQAVSTVAASGQQTIIPNVQILNMRPNAQAVNAQKAVPVLSPRVVIGQQMVGMRPAAQGLTLSSLPGLQPGQQGHLLLKTENGQYQLLRVGTGPAPSQALRLSTVGQQVPVAMSTSVAPTMQVATPVLAPQQVSAPPPPQPIAPPPQIPVQTVHPIVNAAVPKPVDNTKVKCRNFLANLLDLSSKEPKKVEENARTLIQELIDAQVEPEQFCDRLERLLNASPQPCLIGFLKKSLPSLRQSLVTKELVIEGIRPPPTHVAFSPILTSTQEQSVIRPASPLQVIRPASPMPKLVTTKPSTANPNKSISILQNIQIQPQKLNVAKSMIKSPATASKNFTNKLQQQRPQSTVTMPSVVSSPKTLLKEREKKPPSFTQSFTDIDKTPADDDINDVAAMGGVNLAEESQNILGSTEMIGTQIRSCKDEFFLYLPALQNRMRAAAQKYGLQEPGLDVATIISHATQERLKNLIEKLALIAEHRLENVKNDPRYEVTQDVKGQIKFLEELDTVEKKRRTESEREILMKAVKSRSKNEDAEQAKLKAKAKEMQRAEMEEVRQREANATALQAIGPRKKQKLDTPGGSGDPMTTAGTSQPAGTSNATPLRARMKRVNYRDLLFLMEQDKHTAHSVLLYRAYLKANPKRV